MTAITLHNIDDVINSYITDSNGEVIGGLRSVGVATHPGSRLLDMTIVISLTRPPDAIYEDIVKIAEKARKIKI
ncbi:hypothetical protein [Acinetobacter sp.]|uniref:hypothetical protein n=1 Tax=Acinetobacter sp. TaxID=472 RepID=UPI0037519143